MKKYSKNICNSRFEEVHVKHMCSNSKEKFISQKLENFKNYFKSTLNKGPDKNDIIFKNN